MKRILVVDDEEAIRTNLVELLKIEGFDTVGAENGRVGLSLAKQFLPHLVISDVTMPEFTGYDLLSELRKDPASAGIPFVFLTAKTEREDLRKGMTLGADDYLFKPFTRADVLNTVETRFARQREVAEKYEAEISRVEQQLHRSLYFDELTGFPNRLSLRDCFDAALRREGRGLIAVLSLGLSRFDWISSRLGDSFCNQLIQALAGRLAGMVSGEDTVSRLQSHHFVILASASEKQDIERLARNILQGLSQPFVLAGQEVFVTPHIGIALYPNDGTEIDRLIGQADVAMNAVAKEGGCLFFAPKMDTTVGDFELEAALRHALERQEFELHYQPQVDLRTGKVVGAEALLRWRHPVRGLIYPGAFIPLAEETGLIVPIGDWVLATACRQIRDWNQSLSPSLRVAINVSALQFNRNDFISGLTGILKQSGARAENIEVEIVESGLMQNNQSATLKLNQLKALGIRVAVDDFGTGYSSLGYLKHFPLDTVKIDRCFIRNLDEDSANAAITRAIIRIAHNLNLRVIAEGVETVEELGFLHKHRCDEMQGFLFSLPLTVPQFEQLISAGQSFSRLKTGNPAAAAVSRK
jgi:diguanylate cyclase (GGDEF)-like protein